MSPRHEQSESPPVSPRPSGKVPTQFLALQFHTIDRTKATYNWTLGSGCESDKRHYESDDSDEEGDWLVGNSACYRRSWKWFSQLENRSVPNDPVLNELYRLSADIKDLRKDYVGPGVAAARDQRRARRAAHHAAHRNDAMEQCCTRQELEQHTNALTTLAKNPYARRRLLAACHPDKLPEDMIRSAKRVRGLVDPEFEKKKTA